MVAASIFPRRLFAAIRQEKPHREASTRLAESATRDAEGVYRLLETTARGLSVGDAQLRLKQYGPNVLASDSQSGIGRIFLHAVLNPLVILLTTLVVDSFATGDFRADIVMSAMIVLGVGLNLIQEGRANKAAAKLKGMIPLTATVVRDGQPEEIAISQLVPGNIVSLAAGDMIPADVRIVTAKDLYVVQGSLWPVENLQLTRLFEVRV